MGLTGPAPVIALCVGLTGPGARVIALCVGLTGPRRPRHRERSVAIQEQRAAACGSGSPRRSRNLPRALNGRPDFFSVSAPNPLKSPNSAKQIQAYPSKFVWFCLGMLGFACICLGGLRGEVAFPFPRRPATG